MCQLGAAKCRVTGGVLETEKGSLVVPESSGAAAVTL